MTNLSNTILMGLFLLICAVATGASLVLWYHWARYHMKDPAIGFAQIIYFLGLFILTFITLTLLL